ncbi:MAG: hypothetical protein ABJG41_08165 [Cyclobacteriaceae bacterium]
MDPKEKNEEGISDEENTQDTTEDESTDSFDDEETENRAGFPDIDFKRTLGCGG